MGDDAIDLKRRLLLTGVGASAGLLLANDGLPPWANHQSELAVLNYPQTLALLDRSLSEQQRLYTVLPWHHPTRQITNTVAIHNSPHIGTLFNANQMALIRHLYTLNLSNQGLDWLHYTTAFEGKFDGSVFKIFTDANAGSLANASSLQTMLNGGHYMLRDQQSADEAYAFGGPIAYGQQLGNRQYKVQGNAFKAHGDAVHDFHRSLSDAERQQAYQLSPPVELITQIQGPNGQFSGVKIGDTSLDSQALAKEMLNTIFAAYRQHQRQDALSAIEQNGGMESLYLSLYSDFSFYADGKKFSDLSANEKRQAGVPYAQVWRIEGPTSVIHFKGYPHVHGYINIVKDPSRIAIGESIAQIETGIQGDAIGRLLINAMRQQTGERFAFYHREYLGRLSPGIVSTGSIYALDPYDNKIQIVSMLSNQMTSELKHSLVRQGADITPGKKVRFATIDYLVQQGTQLSHQVSDLSSVATSDLSLRDAVIDYIKFNQKALNV